MSFQKERVDQANISSARYVTVLKMGRFVAAISERGRFVLGILGLGARQARCPLFSTEVGVVMGLRNFGG
eukprot:3517477-Rhodomonas_salina.1